MTNTFEVGDLVRYAEKWCTPAERDFRHKVIEAVPDCDRYHIVTIGHTYAIGAHHEWVKSCMIEKEA